MRWVGVVASKQAYERLRGEPKTWWCLPNAAQPGDDLLMYIATKVKIADQHGIAALYKVSALDPTHTSDCRAFGGGYLVSTAVQIELVRKYGTPLSSRDMKFDPVLAGATCVRRSFQSTCFELSAQEYDRALKLLARSNGS